MKPPETEPLAVARRLEQWREELAQVKARQLNSRGQRYELRRYTLQQQRTELERKLALGAAWLEDHGAVGFGDKSPTAGAKVPATSVDGQGTR